MTYEQVPTRQNAALDQRRETDRRPPGASTERERQPRVRFEGAGVTAGLVLLLLVGVVIVAVVAQNTQDVEFDLLWWSITGPLSVFLLGTALLTLAVDQVVGAVWRGRRRKMRELSSVHSS